MAINILLVVQYYRYPFVPFLTWSGGRSAFKGCSHGGRKIREDGKTFCLLNMQKLRPKWLPSGEGKEE